ncbi:TetR/AcrR family transcriptional regulator [Gordonia desulfuricans]|nr:TetR/AcrR family transcriptional regulator [Gordonia desulfuricans]
MTRRPPTRAENREAMETEIRRLAREHLRSHGAAGLSLRAIARDLGVVSSAVYRYVPSRDELLTTLLVEGYTDLADAVEARIDEVDPADHRARIVAGATAVRAWGVGDTARWTLLYGSPVPGYAAPPERTVGPGTRVQARLLHEIADAEAARALRPAALVTAPPAGFMRGARSEFGLSISDEALTAAVTLWSTIVGMVSLEIFGQYGPDLDDADALFAAQLGTVLTTLFG